MERTAANSLPQFRSVRQEGGQLSCLPGRRLETPSLERTSMGEDRGRSTVPPFPRGQEPAECGFGLKEQGGEDFSRMNRLMSPGVSPSDSFLRGRKLLQQKDVRGGLGHRAKCLSARCPRTLVRRQPEPLFLLTISLQLVGELKEEVLVVDDLELAHIGLGLQVMGGRLHIQAKGPTPVFADCPHFFSH